MIAVLRAALVATLVAASIPAVAEGQEPSSDSLIRRIVLLERQAAELEQRVRALEVLIKSEPSQGQPIPASTRWRDLANWRRLRLGMKMDEVRALLGEPERVDAGYVTYWRWSGANVSFISGKLEGWSEPQR